MKKIIHTRLNKLTMNRLFHERFPETITMNLDKIFFLNKIVQFLIRYFPVYEGISWYRDFKPFKMLDCKRIRNQTILFNFYKNIIFSDKSVTKY